MLPALSVQLSTDCRDLLDRIFVVDEKKRISIQDMKKHPWYNKPLPSRLLHAERYLLQEQELLEAHIAERVLDDVYPPPSPPLLQFTWHHSFHMFCPSSMLGA